MIDCSVAVAIPAFNEADGIAGFLREIDRVLTPQVSRLSLVVVDDASRDDTVSVLDAVAPTLNCELVLLRNPANQGHGPSLLHAYHCAVQDRPDYVLQVDGDGQFLGGDLRRVLVLLHDGAHAVCGVRRFRQDPWFRMGMTRMLRGYLAGAFGVRARDANCPLRGYDTALLEQLLPALPPACLIPNLYLTVLAARRGTPLVEVDVSHRVRRGVRTVGSTWSGRGYSPIPWPLVSFSLRALVESLRLARALRGQERAAGPAPPSGLENPESKDAEQPPGSPPPN